MKKISYDNLKEMLEEAKGLEKGWMSKEKFNEWLSIEENNGNLLDESTDKRSIYECNDYVNDISFYREFIYDENDRIIEENYYI